MPPSDLHKKKRGKNLALLAVLLVFIALIFGMTIVKMS